MTKNTTHNHLLPSLLRGLYARVARQMGVDPSYVSRVARGERQSQEISLALEKEMQSIFARARVPAAPEYPAGGNEGS